MFMMYKMNFHQLKKWLGLFINLTEKKSELHPLEFQASHPLVHIYLANANIGSIPAKNALTLSGIWATFYVCIFRYVFHIAF